MSQETAPSRTLDDGVTDEPSAPPAILIVDDEKTTQRLLADALKKQGFSVTVETSGEWALATFSNRDFDAVILDLLLPALSGYEVASQLREHRKGRRVPIIMISGVYTSAIQREEALHKHGAFAFLEKPVDLQRLYETLHAALGDRYPRPHPPSPTTIAQAAADADDFDTMADSMADDLQREEATLVDALSVDVAKPKISFRGQVKKRPFAEVLGQLHHQRVSGRLRLARGKVKKLVYFREGTPELVKSNLLAECLGRILVREKLISQEECDESLRRMKASKRMQGTVLIEMGCLSPHNLQYALQLQLQEKLLDLFRWEVGTFELEPKVQPPPEPVSIDMSCAQLILEGVRRSYTKERIAKHFRDVDHLYVHPTDDPLQAFQSAAFSSEEKEALLLADGHKTVATLRALEILPPLELHRLLYALRCARMIRLEGAPSASRPRISFAEIIAQVRPESALPPPLPAGKKRVTAPDVPRQPAAPPPQLPQLPWSDAPLARPIAQERPPEGQSAQAPPKQQVLATAAAPLLPELSEVVVLPPSSQEATTRERLAAQLAEMSALNHFEVLGVQRGVSREEVKRAYFALARQYHPDKRFQSASAEVRELAQRLYALISAAHDVLSDADERERYERELPLSAPRQMSAGAGTILAAEGKFQKGEELLRQHHYGQASKLFEEAIALSPHEGEFHAHLGWSRFLEDPANADEAIRTLEQAVALDPRQDKSYLFLGYVHKALGRPDKAEKQFEKAIRSNPDCTEALRELRLFGRPRR